MKPNLSIKQAPLALIAILTSENGLTQEFDCYSFGNHTRCEQNSLSNAYQEMINAGDPARWERNRQEQELRQLQIEEMKRRLQQPSTLYENTHNRSNGASPMSISDCDREYPPIKGNFRSQVRCYKSIDEQNGPLSAEAESIYADWASTALKTDNGEIVPKSDLDSLGARYSAYLTKKYGGNSADNPAPSKEEKLDAATTKCSSLGFKKGTVKHGDCVMKLLD